jgi:hypothetical protein
VILNNWPSDIPFCSPADLKSKMQLLVLKNSIGSGVTHFKKLSEEEWAQWETGWIQSEIARDTLVSIEFCI